MPVEERGIQGGKRLPVIVANDIGNDPSLPVVLVDGLGTIINGNNPLPVEEQSLFDKQVTKLDLLETLGELLIQAKLTNLYLSSIVNEEFVMADLED